MPLPTSVLPVSSVVIDGEAVEFRSLSRAEALKLSGMDVEAAELFVLMHGTGCTVDEATEFRNGHDTATAGALIDGILVLSGLANADDDDTKALNTGTSELSQQVS